MSHAGVRLAPAQSDGAPPYLPINHKPQSNSPASVGQIRRVDGLGDGSNPTPLQRWLQETPFQSSWKQTTQYRSPFQSKSSPQHDATSMLDHPNSGVEPGPIPATVPLVVRQDGNGVQWVAFEYSRDRVKMEYTIRCDVESVEVDALTPEFKSENCIYPRACVAKEQYKGSRLAYEIDCNTVGWALAELNPCLRGKRGLIQRAVDSWRNSNSDPRLRSRRVRRQAKMTRRAREPAISRPDPGTDPMIPVEVPSIVKQIPRPIKSPGPGLAGKTDEEHLTVRQSTESEGRNVDFNANRPAPHDIEEKQANTPIVTSTCLDDVVTHTCCQCGKPFSFKYRLRNHEQIVHGLVAEKAMVPSQDYDPDPSSIQDLDLRGAALETDEEAPENLHVAEGEVLIFPRIETDSNTTLPEESTRSNLKRRFLPTQKPSLSHSENPHSACDTGLTTTGNMAMSVGNVNSVAAIPGLLRGQDEGHVLHDTARTGIQDVVISDFYSALASSQPFPPQLPDLSSDRCTEGGDNTSINELSTQSSQSSTKTPGQSSTYSAATSNKITTGRSLQNRLQNDSDGDNSDEEPRRFGKRRRLADSEPQLCFACPFYKFDAISYAACQNGRWLKIDSVRRHHVLGEHRERHHLDNRAVDRIKTLKRHKTPADHWRSIYKAIFDPDGTLGHPIPDPYWYQTISNTNAADLAQAVVIQANNTSAGASASPPSLTASDSVSAMSERSLQHERAAGLITSLMEHELAQVQARWQTVRSIVDNQLATTATSPGLSLNGDPLLMLRGHNSSGDEALDSYTTYASSSQHTWCLPGGDSERGHKTPKIDDESTVMALLRDVSSIHDQLQLS